MSAKTSLIEKICLAIVLGGALLIQLSPPIEKALSTIHIGKMTIPLAPIYCSLVAFFLVMFLTRLIQRFLKNKLLLKTDLNKSTQATIVSVIGYIGLIIAVLWGVSELGVNLKNVTIVAGALSVGIGFGLQNVVNNFISGIILLFGKAIQVNDRVIINGKEGIVRQINIRSTELETTEGIRILIPNASVLSTDLTNLSTQKENNLITLSFCIPLNSDIKAIQKLLLKVVAQEKRIAKTPSPTVFAIDLSGSAITFELSATIKDINLKNQLLSDLRVEVAYQLKKQKLI